MTKEYARVLSIDEVNQWLCEAPLGGRAVYWTGVSGPEPSQDCSWATLFDHLHKLSAAGDVFLFQERIPRRGFDFIAQKRMHRERD